MHFWAVPDTGLMSMTPNGQADMQSRQPLHAFDWMTTVSNSVRMMALVGQTCENTACTQSAHVAHHQPASVLAVFGKLFDELDVPPMDAVELAGVVVAVATQRVHPAIGAGQLVPFLAGDLARLAADADRRVGVEPHRLRHSCSGRSLPAKAGSHKADWPSAQAWLRSLRSLQVTHERLAFVNRHVRVAHQRGELVADTGEAS